METMYSNEQLALKIAVERAAILSYGEALKIENIKATADEMLKWLKDNKNA